MAVVPGAAVLAALLETEVDVTDAWRKRDERWSECWGVERAGLEGVRVGDVRLGDGERGLVAAPRPGCLGATGSGLEAPESAVTELSSGGCDPRGDASRTGRIGRAACCGSSGAACVGCRFRMCRLRLPAWLAWYEQ